MTRFLTSLALALLAAGGMAEQASASHMRFRSISWEKTGVSGAVRFTTTQGERCTYTRGSCPAPGETFSGSGTYFGDGSFGGSSYSVTASNQAEDWMVGTATDDHTYAVGSGPQTAVTSGSATLGTLHNNANGTISAQTLVDTAHDSESPVTSVPTIVDVGDSGLQTWSIPAVDPGGQPLRWRLANGTEACGGCADPNPPGLAITPTGRVTWDTTGKALGLWFTSAVIEALGPTGTVVSSTQATYLVRVSSRAANAAPDWSADTPADGTAYSTKPGSAVTFTVKADDADTGDTVHIDKLGLPGGATFAATDGNPAKGTFSWTPTAAQSGDYLVTVTAQDSKSPPAQATSRTYSIHVSANAAPVVSPAAPDAQGSEGDTLTTSGGFTDAESDPMVLTADNTQGTFVDHGDGTWSWSLPTSDQVATHTIVVRAADGQRNFTSDTFDYGAANVAPAVTMSSGNPSSVDEGATERTFSYSITDPGTKDTESVVTTCGANATDVPASATSTATGGSFRCVFPDGPATSLASATATDSDGATGAPGTVSVNVANVAPIVTIDPNTPDSFPAGPAEQTIAYAISDPGKDTVASVQTSCGTAGEKSAGSDSHDDGSGQFRCVFAHGPDQSELSAQATDSDGDSRRPAARTVRITGTSSAPPASDTAPAGDPSPPSDSSPPTDASPDTDAASLPPRCADTTAPRSRFGSLVRLADGRVRIGGHTADLGCSQRVSRVRFALGRHLAGGDCRWLKADGRFGAAGSCLRPVYLDAEGTADWTFTTPSPLAAGRYIAWARSGDRAGNEERKGPRPLRRFRIR